MNYYPSQEDNEYWDDLTLPESGTRGYLRCRYVNTKDKWYWKRLGHHRCRQRVRMNLRGHHNKRTKFYPVTSWWLS
jgi:hypothetical protein